jgi:hypothetical protein
MLYDIQEPVHSDADLDEVEVVSRRSEDNSV